MYDVDPKILRAVIVVWVSVFFCASGIPLPVAPCTAWAQATPDNPSSTADQPGLISEPLKPEVIDTVRRDDPSTALFLSGAGFKILDPRSIVGVSGRTTISEETHRIDSLLINSIRKGFNDPAFDPRSMLTEPVDVRNLTGSVIFDDPTRPDLPRLTFTYEDVLVDSDSSIVLDFKLQVHEIAVLWTTPYLDDDRRFRITFEPIYQYFHRTTDTGDPDTPEDIHRGLVNMVLHDEQEQREFFFQVLYGRGNFRDTGLDEIQQVYRAEWRQWYGSRRAAFSTVGVALFENDFTPDGRPRDAVRDFELLANLILELDDSGRWRWFNQIKYNHEQADLFLNLTAGSANHVFDFFRMESRITHEVVRDVDVSLGLEHAVADSHQFDSLALVGRVSVFNLGPFRGQFEARNTWYYNLDEQLATVFFEINFAQ